jgi:hypothetical protein
MAKKLPKIWKGFIVLFMKNKETKTDDFSKLFDLAEKAKNDAIAELKLRKADLAKQMADVEKYLLKLGVGSPKVATESTTPTIKNKRKKRIKRDQVALEKDAADLVKKLESSPEGLPASALREIADFGQSLPDFVKKYAKRTVKPHGGKRDRTYTVA